MIRISPRRILVFMFVAMGLPLVLPEAQAADSKRSLSQAVQAMPEEAYIGGMPPRLSQLAADARRRLQMALGQALPACNPSDPRQGLIVATGVGTDAPKAETQVDPLLAELQVMLKHERRFIRDAAAYVIGEIGPAAAQLEPDLSGKDIHRSPWFTHALGRISCQQYGMTGDVAFIPSQVRSRLVGSDKVALSEGLKVRLLAGLLNYTKLRWPDKFFSSFIDRWELQNTDGALDQIAPNSVLAIADRAVDEAAPHTLRVDLLDLLSSFGTAASPASERLWPIANGSDNELAFAAAQTVMGAGAAHAVTAASLLLNRFDVELSMLSEDLCSAPGAADILSPQAHRRLSGSNWSEASDAAKWLGCLDPIGNAALLRAHLDHPSWETQIAVISALSPSAQVDSTTQQALRRVQSTHWSGLVRQEAEKSLHPPPPKEEAADELLRISFNCFHRCLTDHLRQCGDDQGIVDGLYVSPSMGELSVEWERARRVPTPNDFPIEVLEDSRPDYGTSTYLRIGNGWLYGTDRWHYDGVIGYIDDRGNTSEIGEWGADVVAFVDTPHFGPVMLGSSLFTVGHAGLLAEVERDGDHWKLVPRVALPSPPWGWAFAPNGTLLVADPHEAVAVLRDGSIESLACPVRSPEPQPKSLLAAARKAPRALGVRAQRDADDALKLHASALDSQKTHALQLERDPSLRQTWEKAETVKGWLDQALDELLAAYLSAGRAGEALRALESTPTSVASASLELRFQVYAAAGHVEKARMQLNDMSESEDAAALKLQAMLALAEGRVALARSALDRIQALAEKSSIRQSEDPYLPLLRGFITKEWPERETEASNDEAIDWPSPIGEYLAGRSDEETLARASYTRDGRVDRKKLCEALFFNGLKLAQEGRKHRARAHFRAAAALQVQNFHEHAVARVILGDRGH